MKSAVVSNF